jgi:mono/diheme cytochrome c family protein
VSKQLHYIASAFLLLILLAGSFLFIKIIPFDRSTETDEQPAEISQLETNQVMSASIAKGKDLFLSKCASCHNIFKETAYPSLIGFEDRGPWSDRKKLYEWIRNPSAFIKKDAYAQELKSKFGVTMTAFPDLTNEEIDAIVEYIRENNFSKTPAMQVAIR